MQRMICAGAALICTLSWATCQAETSPGSRLYEDVRRYAAFGPHRTGTAADIEPSEWLARELESAGMAVEQRRFSVLTFEPEAAALQTGGGEVRGFPAWFPHATPATGVQGILSEMHAGDTPAGAIAFVDAGTAGIWHEVDVAEWARRAAAGGAAGLVLAIDHVSGEQYQPNTEPPHVQTPLPLPVLLAPAAAAAAIKAARGQEATLRLSGTQRATYGLNLLGRLQRGDGPWIVVSTPTSGWFRAAGERGPGVALWLALARAAAARNDGRNYLFIAASGHELDYLGARTLLAEEILPPPAAVQAWLHLGASIGVRDWKVGDSGLVPLDRVQPRSFAFAADTLRGAADRTLAALPGIALHAVADLPASRGGELALYRDAGYPMIGFAGAHRFFHTPRDLPDVTSAALLAPYGNALQRLLAALAEED